VESEVRESGSRELPMTEAAVAESIKDQWSSIMHGLDVYEGDDAKTAKELAALFGCSVRTATNRLQDGLADGRVQRVRVMRTSPAGNRVIVPAYIILGDAKE